MPKDEKKKEEKKQDLSWFDRPMDEDDFNEFIAEEKKGAYSEYYKEGTFEVDEKKQENRQMWKEFFTDEGSPMHGLGVKPEDLLNSEGKPFFFTNDKDHPIDLSNPNVRGTISFLNAVQNEGVIVPGKDLGSTRVIYAGEDRIPILSDSIAEIAEKVKNKQPYNAKEKEMLDKYAYAVKDRQGALKQEEVKKEAPKRYSPTDLQEKELDAILPTLTSKYPGASLDELMDSGIIVDKDGKPFPKEENPYDRYSKVFDAMTKEEGVYIQDNLSRKKDQQAYKCTIPKESLNAVLEGKAEPKIERLPENVIRPGEKAKIVEALSGVNETLKNTYSSNAQFNNIKKQCNASLEKIKKLTTTKDIQEELTKLSDLAGGYTARNACKDGMTDSRLKRVELCNKIYDIKKAVDRGQDPAVKQDGTDVALRSVAMRYARAQCVANMKNDKYKNRAKEILTKPGEFNKYVDAVMQNKTFKDLYGQDNEASNIRLIDAIGKSDLDLLKEVDSKRIELKRTARLEREAANKAAGKRKAEAEAAKRKAALEREKKIASKRAQLEKLQKKYRPLDYEERETVADKISNLHRQMNTADKRTWFSSSEFDEFNRMMVTTDAKLQNGDPVDAYDMQRLAEAADGYLIKKMDEKIDSKSAAKIEVVKETWKTAESARLQKPMTDEDFDRHLVELKVGKAYAQGLANSKDAGSKEYGKELLSDPSAFHNALEQLRDKGLLDKVIGECGGPEAIKDMKGSEIHKKLVEVSKPINQEMLAKVKEEKEIHGPENEEVPKQKNEEVKQPVKEDKKDKEEMVMQA